MKKITQQIQQNWISMKYLFQAASECDKWLLPLMLISIISDAITPFIIVILPKYIIDELTMRKRFPVAIAYVILFFVLTFLISNFTSIVDGIVNCKKEKLIQQHYKFFSDKTMSMDMQDIENPTVSDQKQRAENVITWNSRNIDGIKNALGGILSYSIQIIGFSYILITIYVIIKLRRQVEKLI